MNKRKYTIYRVPCTWNSTYFIIKKYQDGHYYWNRVQYCYTDHTREHLQPYLRNSRFTRVKKSWLKEIGI